MTETIVQVWDVTFGVHCTIAAKDKTLGKLCKLYHQIFRVKKYFENAHGTILEKSVSYLKMKKSARKRKYHL